MTWRVSSIGWTVCQLSITTTAQATRASGA
jgi:hypothetical protein